jgi:hypothetical protein
MLNFFSRKAKVPADVEGVSFSAPDLRNLNFYQFKAGTAPFFFDRLGSTRVTIADTPHFKFASALLAGDKAAIATAEAFYHEYLSAS